MTHGRLYSTFEVQLRAVRAVLRGMSVIGVAEAFGVDRRTLHRWLVGYERGGEAELGRRQGSGRPRKLPELGEEDFRRLVLRLAGSFGFETDLWTVARLHAVLEQRLGVAVSRDTLWRRLREAGVTYQKPERQYWQADEEARQQWLSREVPRIRRAAFGDQHPATTSTRQMLDALGKALGR